MAIRRSKTIVRRNEDSTRRLVEGGNSAVTEVNCDHLNAMPLWFVHLEKFMLTSGALY